jgi:catechol 2,3-dioxygenase-like lactoylglutathione lyase family enzyme
MSLTHALPVAMLTTSDRNAAEPFYADVLGLPRLPDDPFAALFDCGGVTLRLTQVPGFAASPYPVLGWRVGDIEDVVSGLAAKGVAMNVYEGLGQDARGIWTGPDGTRVAFFNDPDGNALTLTQPG